MITGNIRLVGKEPTQFLIDPLTSEGNSSGLKHQSAVKCENLMTIAQSNILRTIGFLSDDLTRQLDQCLKAALELS
ncbi:MAG: type II toxin-antitoxin system PemK/MazF family toxin [Planctomycetes bacterium]|nr:type II toxin-antitoxin system PemK/MazF family toxin [Planctomycetota bacterium]